MSSKVALSSNAARASNSDSKLFPQSAQMTPRLQGAAMHPAAQEAAGSQQDHELAFQHFYEWWDSDQAKIGPSGSQFVPSGNLTSYFGHNNCMRLYKTLHALFPSGIPQLIDPPTFLQKYIRVYAILLSIGQGAHILHFLRHQYDDKKLPFETRPRSFPKTPRPEDDFWNDFYARQWMVSPEPMHYGNEVHLVQEVILPIVTKEKICEGSAAVIYKIELHPQYNHLHEHDSAEHTSNSPQSNYFVLKTYGSHTFDLQHHQHERDAYLYLRRTKRLGGGLLGFFGSFIHGDEQNIILEYADRGTLEEFLQGVEPANEEDIFRVWNGVFRVLEGLVRLHEVLPSKETDPENTLSGWHQDINPTNILAKSCGTGSRYDCEFALADLGLSHFKKETGEDMEDGDSHGTREYGAPECYRRDEFDDRSFVRVTNKLDVWSLGAVLSEVATWIVSRTDGLEKYREDRRRITAQDPLFRDIGCFHDGSCVLKYVTTHHRILRQRVRRFDLITPQALDIIDDMLFPANARPNASHFRARFARLLENADPSKLPQSLDPTTPPTSTGSSGATPFSSPGEIGSHWSGQMTDLSSPGSPTHHRNRSSQNQPENYAVFQDRGQASSQPGLASEPSNTRQASYSDHSHTRQRGISFPGGSQQSDAYRNDSARMNTLGSQTYPLPTDSGTPFFNSQFLGTAVAEPVSYEEAGSHSRTNLPPAPATSMPNTSEWPQLSVSEALQWLETYKVDKGMPFPNDSWRKELEGRDSVFIIDDSVSMRPYWNELVTLLKILGFITKKSDDNGVDIYFMNSSEKLKKVTKSTRLVELTARHKPKDDRYRRGNIDQILQSRLIEHSKKLKNAANSIFGVIPRPNVRPLTLYIFTDGVWQSASNPVKPIIEMIRVLHETGRPGNQVGIQFIQFGNDEKGRDRLEYLDSKLIKRFGLEWDMVDTEPSTGNVWKMLLGAINKTLDNDKKDAGHPETWYRLFGIEAGDLYQTSSSPPASGWR